MENTHLHNLSQMHGVSGDETDVRNYLANSFNTKGYKLSTDKLGSLIATNEGDEVAKVSLVAHMDEVGMIVSYIDDSGLIYFNPIGSWFKQSMLNHRVAIKTSSDQIFIGLIGSASPHALPDGLNTKIEIDEMFIDIGYDSKAEVKALGIEMGNFICPIGQYTEVGNKIISKALDNRVGCALLLDIEEEVTNSQININYVGTVQEEVGLRGAQTSSTVIETDIAIVVDVTICGDTPNVDSKKFQTNMGDGPSICLFDKRTIPNKKLLAYVKQVAVLNDIDVQYYTMQTGATDAGRYNVMAGGSAVISIAIPSRYVHANNSMISSEDYLQTKKLIKTILNDLDQSKVNSICQF